MTSISKLDLVSKGCYFSVSMDSGQQSVLLKTFARASGRRRLTAAGVFLAIAGSFGAFWLVGRYNIILWPFACGFEQIYDLPCPTCGMTHSVLAFARGDIFLSFYYQPASAVFCLLVVITAFFAFLMAVFGIYSPSFERRLVSIKLRYIFAAVLLIFAVGWAVMLTRAIIQHGSS